MSLDAWCGLTTNSTMNEKATVAVFDTIKKIAMKRISDSAYNTKKSSGGSSVSSDGSKTPTQVRWDTHTKSRKMCAQSHRL